MESTPKSDGVNSGEVMEALSALASAPITYLVAEGIRQPLVQEAIKEGLQKIQTKWTSRQKRLFMMRHRSPNTRLVHFVREKSRG